GQRPIRPILRRRVDGLAALAIALYPIWLPLAWSPALSRAFEEWLSRYQARMAALGPEYEAAVHQLERQVGAPRTRLERWRFWRKRVRLWKEIRRRRE